MNQRTPVNLESEVTKKRKEGEAVKYRTLSEEKRKEANDKRKQAVRLNRQAEREDDKAEAADNHAQAIQKYRKDDLASIAKIRDLLTDVQLS